MNKFPAFSAQDTMRAASFPWKWPAASGRRCREQHRPLSVPSEATNKTTMEKTPIDLDHPRGVHLGDLVKNES